MPLKRTPQALTATVDDATLKVSFYFADAAAPIPGELRATIVVETDGEPELPQDIAASSALTVGNLTTLTVSLRKLRDKAVANLGYIDEV